MYPRVCKDEGAVGKEGIVKHARSECEKQKRERSEF